jgi:DNA helicase-2/ATP-dependent DNA helicase PcrA
MTRILTPTQQEAVEHGDGPLLLIAGAGTGKTLVITHRIAHLIATKKARPHEILALTFTEKAAAEMEERVDLLTPYGYTDVRILTFHAFGDRLLREFGMRIGLSPDFHVMSWAEQTIFFKKHLFDFPLRVYRPLGNPSHYIDSILRHISRAKDEDIAPEAYLAEANRLLSEAELHPKEPDLKEEATLQAELAGTYQLYQQLMHKNQSVDFGDQVSLALSLLRQVPSVLKKLPYRYILVDEFQDTNYVQFQLVQALAQQAAIAVVGDDDQSIYRCRGAANSNIQRFTEIYPSARRIVLTENFRSDQPILDAAYGLIQYNNPNRLEVIEKVDKRLHSQRLPSLHEENVLPKGPTVHYFDTLSTEADWVATTIANGMAKGQTYGDFAILVRKNAAADSYIRALNLRSIPNRFTGNRGLFNRPEVRIMIAFLRLLIDSSDSISLYYLLASDLYPFPIQLLSRQMTMAKRKNRSLYTLLTEMETTGATPAAPASEGTIENEHPLSDGDPLWEKGRAAFLKLKTDLDQLLNRSREVDAGVVLYEFIHSSGLLARFSRMKALSDESAIQNIARFFGEIRGIGQWTQTRSLHEVVEALDLLLAAGEDPPAAEADLSDDAVRVLTVHRAKGLEFHTVFMVGLTEGSFPTRNRSESLSLPARLAPGPVSAGDAHLEEERRLFYVGMTRAKRRLFLTGAEQNQGGETGKVGRPRKISSFVMEALNLPKGALAATKTPPLTTIDQEGTNLKPVLDTPHVAVSPLNEPPVKGERLQRVDLPPLNFYRIDDYMTCPLKYKYIHILGVPIYSHHAIVYGSVMHKAVAAYLLSRQGESPLSLTELLGVFEKGWISEGYLSRTHEDQRMAAGKEALTRFYQEETAGRCPTYVEKEFSFPFEGIRMKGRWDRVDETDAGAVIIDYKTSEVSDQKGADKKAKESQQLALYAWAYQEKTGTLPVRASLHFLETGLIGTTVQGEREIEKIKDTVRKAAAGIRAGDFTARPTFMACRYCAYQNICPYTASGE